ncbi:MAG TPA: PaaI family thioesterase [Acidimicrobiales bacterium]|jgi:acyl-coenzyme A thioesterase PaaI-like protein|nr:PaaI family thioesterase [Acidimicrobiales bacterium]
MSPEPSEVTPQRAQARRLATAMRDVIERLVATKAPADVLEDAAAQLEAIAGSLAGYDRGHSFEGFGDGSFAESANSGNTHAFFDHSPLIGLANPLAPPLQLQTVDGQVIGAARFGSAYEGPPGCVHGGFIAAAFDEVLGMAQSLGGRPGMTGTLTIRYRRPTPLHADLRFEATLDRVEGRKIFTTGRLLHGDDVTAEAEAIFITVDFAKMAQLAREQGPRG